MTRSTRSPYPLAATRLHPPPATTAGQPPAVTTSPTPTPPATINTNPTPIYNTITTNRRPTTTDTPSSPHRRRDHQHHPSRTLLSPSPSRHRHHPRILTTAAIMATAAISKPPPPGCHHHHVTFTTPLKSPSSSTIGCPTKIATTPPQLLTLTHHQPTAALSAFSFFLLDLVFEGVCFYVLIAREGVFVSAVNQPNRAFGFTFNTQTGVFGSAVKGRLVR
ncbi:hypothetical protein Tco_1565553, partial [Tanacetum coccineum]